MQSTGSQLQFLGMDLCSLILTNHIQSQSDWEHLNTLQEIVGKNSLWEIWWFAGSPGQQVEYTAPMVLPFMGEAVSQGMQGSGGSGRGSLQRLGHIASKSFSSPENFLAAGTQGDSLSPVAPLPNVDSVCPNSLLGSNWL